jgi:hypothetical protein
VAVKMNSRCDIDEVMFPCRKCRAKRLLSWRLESRERDTGLLTYLVRLPLVVQVVQKVPESTMYYLVRGLGAYKS